MGNLTIAAWDGGITDHYLNGYQGAGRRFNNLVLNDNKKPVQHPGLTIFNSSAPQLPPGEQQVDATYFFDNTAFAKSGTKLYYSDGGGAWTALAGPTGNDAFADSELGAKCTFSEWRGHLFITPGPSANKKGGCRTVKVYRNASGTWFLVQAGMPPFKDATFGGFTISNGGVGFTVLYTYIEHYVLTREYVAQVNGVNTVFKDYGAPYVDQDTYVYKISSGNDANEFGSRTFTNTALENYDETKIRIEKFRTKADQTELLFVDSYGQSVQMSDDKGEDELGETTIDLDITSSASAASGIFTVASGFEVYLYVGQEVTIDDANSSALSVFVIAMNYATRRPTLSLTRGGAAADLSAYTTSQNAFIRVTYQSKIPLGYESANYNDPAPPAYFTTVADSYGWYAAPVDTAANQHRATRLTQSKPNDIDAVPSGNYVDIPTDKITAFGLAGQYPVVFSRDACYRVEGRYDAFGNGQLRAILISKTEGAVSQDLALTPTGIYFASENGWCWTDGFSVVNFSKKNLKATYAALNNKDKMTAAFDAQSQRVYFGVETADTSMSEVTGTNNAAYILDLEATKSGNAAGGVFTTRSAGANFQPTALHYDSKNQRMLIGDKRGYIFTFDDAVYTDPVVDTAAAYSTWAKQAVVWDYRSVAHNFGSSRHSKRMAGVFMTLKNLTGDLSMNVYSYKDDRSTPKNMRLVRERSITTGLHKINLNYPKYHLNLINSELQFKKGYVIVARSDDHALATTNGATNVATLLSGSWPSDGGTDLRGHTLWLGPTYAAGWTITAQSGAAVTVLDPGNTFPTDGVGLEWVVMGYPKGETVEFDTLDIEFNEYVEGYPERAGDGGNN